MSLGVGEAGGVVSVTDVPGAVPGDELHAAPMVRTKAATATTHVRSSALPDSGNCNTKLQTRVSSRPAKPKIPKPLVYATMGHTRPMSHSSPNQGKRFRLD